jgi:hypothetical protein
MEQEAASRRDSFDLLFVGNFVQDIIHTTSADGKGSFPFPHRLKVRSED